MKSVFKPFPLPLTGKQWFYLGFLQGFGAGLVDFGANFAIAFGMYKSQDVVKMWVFSQNTIAGDLGVTCIIQTAVSMLITSSLVHTDLHSKAIQPLPFCYPHVEHLPDPQIFFQKRPKRRSISPDSASNGTVVAAEANGEKSVAPQLETWNEVGTFTYHYWMLVRFIFEGTEKNMMFAKPGFTNWLGRLAWTALQGIAIGVVFGFPLWCLAIVVLGPIYGNTNMGSKWAPQVIKGVYGAILGWITNPVIATLALGSQAEHHLIVVTHDEEQGVHEGQEVLAEPTPTIPEDEILPPPDLRMRSDPLTPSRYSHRGTVPSRSRSRANTGGSVHSTPSFRDRPPLTTNVSYLAPLPLGSPLPATPTPGEFGWSRPRGSTVTSIGSTRSWSYALGGTGGRAQRSRSNTATSATFPTISVLQGARSTPVVPQGPSTAPPAVWDGTGQRESGSPLTGRPMSSPGGLRAGTGGV